jgi:peptide/nickel transport system substrate-binding protein
VASDHYTLLPNRYYYDKSKIKFSKVILRVIPDPTTMLQAFQAGQLQVAEGDYSTAAAAAANGTVVLSPGDEQAFTFDVGGSLSKPLADVRVRQALNYAVDRKTIAKALFGQGAAAISDIGSVDGQDTRYQSFYPYNPAKARALLAAAGYGNGFTIDEANVGGWCGTPGPPLAQAVAKYFAAVGVTLKIHVYETFGDWATAVLTKPSAMIDFCAGLSTTWSMWSIYSVEIKPGSVFNRIGPGWNDKVLFGLWAKGSRAANAEPYWRQMTARLTTQAYYLPLVTSPHLYYVSKKIGGYSTKGGDQRDYFPK